MIYLWLTLLIIVNTFWLLLILLAMPGNWLMITTASLFTLWQKGTFSVWTIIAAFILAFAGEVFEFFAGAGGARVGGGGKKAMAAAVIGAITGAMLGTMFIPIIIFGTLIGSALGAAAAVLIVEKKTGKELKQSLRAATGAGIGQFAGLGAKFVVGIIIWIIFAIAAFA